MRRSVVKSASRTLEVLELFSERRRPLRLHEIYEHLDYPQSSATNLLKSMVVMGYLNYNRAARTYIPTSKVGSLGNWLPSFMYGHRTTCSSSTSSSWRRSTSSRCRPMRAACAC